MPSRRGTVLVGALSLVGLMAAGIPAAVGVGGDVGGSGLGVGVPSVSIVGVPPFVTQLLMVAAGVASLVAIAVTALGIRRL